MCSKSLPETVTPSSSPLGCSAVFIVIFITPLRGCYSLNLKGPHTLMLWTIISHVVTLIQESVQLLGYGALLGAPRREFWRYNPAQHPASLSAPWPPLCEQPLSTLLPPWTEPLLCLSCRKGLKPPAKANLPSLSCFWMAGQSNRKVLSTDVSGDKLFHYLQNQMLSWIY